MVLSMYKFRVRSRRRFPKKVRNTKRLQTLCGIGHILRSLICREQIWSYSWILITCQLSSRFLHADCLRNRSSTYFTAEIPSSAYRTRKLSLCCSNFVYGATPTPLFCNPLSVVVYVVCFSWYASKKMSSREYDSSKLWRRRSALARPESWTDTILTLKAWDKFSSLPYLICFFLDVWYSAYHLLEDIKDGRVFLERKAESNIKNSADSQLCFWVNA